MDDEGGRMVKKSTTCSKWRGQCEMGGNNEDVPLLLLMVEGEGGASGGGCGGSEFGQFGLICIRRNDSMEGGRENLSETKGKLGSC